MKVDHKKFGIMKILRRRVSEGEQQVVDGISIINDYKYLGVTVDNDLSFETQIDQLSKGLLLHIFIFTS